MKVKHLFNRYFPTPAYLNMDACGIDMSDRSIKYSQLVSTSAGLKLLKFGSEKIPEGVLVNGKVENEKKLIEILKNLKDKEGLNFIRASLPEEQMYVFTLSLPKTNIRDLSELISLQIEEYIPLKATEAIFDYSLISEDEKNIIVEVSAVSQEVIYNYLSIFSKVGLVPLSFESEAQAINRAVIKEGDNGTVMIVDFGHLRTGVSISQNGNVLFTTTLDIGGYNLTEMLAKNFEIPFEKAEEMKRSYGISNVSKTNDIFPIILNGISVLRDELDKQYVYWKTHLKENEFKHDPIDRIILCGGNSNLSGLADYLEASMKIKVEYANSWVNITDIKTNIPEISFEDSLSYATVIGLALGSFSLSSNKVINLLPNENKIKLKKTYWARLTTVFLNLVSLVGVLSILLLLPSYFLSSAKETIAEGRLESFNRLNDAVTNSNLDEMINDINNKLMILSSQDVNNEIFDKVFAWPLDNRPEGISFTQILYKERTDGGMVLDVHGFAKDRTTLRDFKTLLDSNPSCNQVDLPISNFLEKENLNFTVSITFKKNE